MGLTAEILAATLRGRRRLLKGQTGRTADMLFAAWAVLVVFIRFTLNCALAVRELRAGSHAAGTAIAEFCQLHALGVAALFTFLAASLSLGTAGLDRRRLVLTPVPFARLLTVEIAGLLASPVSAVVLIFIFPAAAPLVFAARPLAGLASLLLCFAAAIGLGASLAVALSSSPRAGRIAGPLRGISAAVLVALVLANFDFAWKGGPVRLSVFMQWTLLDDGAGGGLLPLLRPWSPSAWIAARGVSAPAGLLLAGALAAAAVSLFALGFHRALRAAGRGARAGAGRLRLGAGLGVRRGWRPARAVFGGSMPAAMFRHELRALASRRASMAGAAAALACTAWTILSREASLNIPVFGAILALASLFPYASNLFGADGHALGRYLMASPDWGAVLACRNAAYGTAAVILVAPIAAAAAARISFAAACGVALTALLVASLHGLWGNVSSMILPSAEHGAKARPPAFANQVAHAAAWVVPLVLHRSVAPLGTAGYAAAAGACLAGAALLSAAMARRARRHLGDEVESILGRM